MTWPLEIRDIAREIEAAGYEVYLVGGAVRNQLLGLETQDFDLATNARPSEMAEVFSHRQLVLTGIKYGTVRVKNNYGFHEVTTFRKEGGYLDGRHPGEIAFTNSLAEDLKRRDFTMNALAWNPHRGLVDMFSGREDIKRGIIKTVGPAEERLGEDYLRMIRAVRFMGQLNFSLDPELASALSNYHDRIGLVARERIGVEFAKILTNPDPRRSLEALMEFGMVETLWPMLARMEGFPQKSPHHQWTLWEHTLKTLCLSPNRLETRFAALFHDVGKPSTQTLDHEGVAHYYGHEELGGKMAYEEALRLGYGKAFAERVYRLIAEHMKSHVAFKDKGLKRLLNRIGPEARHDLVALWKADRLATRDARPIDDILEKEAAMEEILNRKEVYEKSQLAINGHDLIRLGFHQGKEVGKALEILLDEVLEDASKNNKKYLCQRGRDILKGLKE